MSKYAVEFAIFPGSQTYHSNPSTIDPVCRIAGTAPGAKYVYTGVQAEDKKTVYLVAGWETVQHHLDLTKNKAAYDPLVAGLAVAIEAPASAPGPDPFGALDLSHVEFTSDPQTAIAAPVTEVLWISPKNGELAAETESKVHALNAALGKSPAVKGIAFGPSVEKKGVLVFVIGWDNIESHKETVTNVAEARNAADGVRSVADVAVNHVSLTKFNV